MKTKTINTIQLVKKMLGLSCDFATNSGKYTLGIVFILLCAVIWAGASVLIQYIYEDLDFRSPFFVTYMATSLLAFHLPAHFANKIIREKIEQYRAIEEDTVSLGYTTVSSNGDPESESSSDLHLKQSGGSLVQRWFGWIPAEHVEVIKVAMIICPLWFGANCFYNYSLLMTSVSSSTIISNLSASFTLAFSWGMGIEDASIVKVVGIIICFGGAVSVGLQDDSTDSSSGGLAGDVMAVFGSIGYGLYTTAIRYKVPEEGQVSMQLLLGYIGLINAILLAPALVAMFVMHLGNVEDITGKVVGFITLNGFADTVLADYFWARAVILTSPTVATIGMSVTIPIAIITDYVLKGTTASWISVFGAVLVVIGFILVNIGPDLFDRYFSAVRDYVVEKITGSAIATTEKPATSVDSKSDRQVFYEQISPINADT